MDRRAFFVGAGAGLATLMLGGCAATPPDKQAVKQVAPVQAGNDTKISDKAAGGKMKITVITGSPHKEGTSALLAERFIDGAKAVGHEVFRFNAAFEDVSPCNGCDRCGMNGPCIYKDSMNKLNPELLASDLVAFVTPLYYYDMSAQIKTVIDRFYANNSKLMGNKKAVLMVTAYANKDWTMNSITEHYKTLVRYLRWEDRGMVLAVGCGARSDIERSDFPNQAYKLGLSV